MGRPRLTAAMLLLSLALAVVMLILWPGTARAHALDQSYMLPVPLWLYLWGAFAAVAASFVVVLVADTTAITAVTPGTSMPIGVRRTAAVVGRGLGLALWFGAILTGLLDAVHSFLPATLFWVLIWAGLPIVAAVIGNPWPSVSPFRAIYGLLSRITDRPLDLGVAYPPGLGRWPAIVLLLIGLLLELTVAGSELGGFVGTLLLVYTLITLGGMAVFGPVAWLRNGEVLEVLLGWFGRIGPVGRQSISRPLCVACESDCDPSACIDCPECVAVGDESQIAIVIRRPLAGLADVRGTNWSDAAFILLALAGVTFDGLQETSLWVDFSRAAVEGFERVIPLETAFVLVGPLGLVGVWVCFLAIFALASTATRALAGASPGLAGSAGRYASTLLPIAAGYTIAHYLTLLIQGVASLPGMLLDPNAVEAQLDWLPAGFVWYLSVAAIVAGHVAAVLLAHREALRLGARRPAVAELPLVILMLGYTVLSLWIIAQPITIDVR